MSTTRAYGPVAVLNTFFVFVFALAWLDNPHYPVMIIAGESSVGTWMSGVLLTVAAAACLVISVRQGWWPWLLLAVFFFALAADERFMYHERMKEWIIFHVTHSVKSRGINELPVMAGAAGGAAIAWIMWQKLAGIGRTLLLAATLLGAISVTMDVLSAGVLWEDSCKLLAELCISNALLLKVGQGT